MQAASAISRLSLTILPFQPDDTVNHVADCFLQAEYQPVLSMPIVDGDTPVGVISRYRLNEILMKQFGRDLYGKRPVSDFMNRDFLSVEISTPLAEAAQYLAGHMRLPLSEDFIITRQGAYQGIGAVLSLLGAMEKQAVEHSAELGKAYRELKASQAQLIQSEKMASLGQMVAGVAHEINTPLGYVRNNVEMLAEFSGQLAQLMREHRGLAAALLAPDGDASAIETRLAAIAGLEALIDPDMLFADQETLLGDTLYGLGQIGELVTGLKNFSRLDQSPTANVSLNDCIESALLIARNTLKNRTEVIKQLGELPHISCAPSQINQVLLNLLTNAAQAIADRGKILIRSWADDAAVYVSVQDSGKGIEAEHLKKIFDPFFTTKPVGEGTGLGLSISYKIIQQHGGSIRVASEVGRGTRFVIVLPRQKKTSAAVIAASLATT